MYIPEMIFGELLTGSNFDDGQKKVTGGRNGYGAKLTNIYSTSFCLESADSQRKKMIKIRWKDNMSIKENPIIKEYNKGSDYVEIKFIPDYKRFKLNNITEDIYQLFKKRVYDLAGVMGKKVKIFFN
jgi:DNA topoisomerase-2